MLEYIDKFDYSYHGVKYEAEDGGMAIKYDNGLLDDIVTIEPSYHAGINHRIVRVTNYDDGEEIYKQRFDITGLAGGKRYIMSGSYPIAEIEYVNENEYRIRVNPLYSMRTTADFITVEMGKGGIGFYDGDKYVGRWMPCDDGVCADINGASLPYAHLLILPILYLIFMPSEGSIMNNDMELLFNKVNERTEYYLTELKKLRMKDLLRDVHQMSDWIDLAVSPRVNLLATVSCYWPNYLMMAAEIETFREKLIGMWTPDGIIEGDRYMQQDIEDISMSGRRKPFLEEEI